ncbi:MAG: hypothetical protein ACRCU1_11520 [Alsobacter sp.]
MTQQEAYDPNKHVPVTVDEIPEEASADMTSRPDIPPPSAYARTAVVEHRRTRKRAVVHRVDFVTRQMRLWYPDRSDLPREKQFDARTEWQSFDEWDPIITFSPDEVERQNAVKLFEDELLAFDAQGLALVKVFCDDDDPVKSLAKVRALKLSGMVRTKDGATPAPAPPMVIPEEPATTPKKGSK